MLILLLFLLPLALSAAGYYVKRAEASNWWEARRDSSQQAPDPVATPEAVLQVYAARAFSWRGIFGVHTWIAYKPAGAAHYSRLEVVGWGVRRGGVAIRAGNGTPDAYWYGNRPEVLVDLRGPEAAAAIPQVEAAARSYPWNDRYRIWPGPNSNTFIAYIARQVPALRLDMPANALGKDYLDDRLLAAAPSGTGWQVSLYGLAGVTLALEEGVEVNLLGLGLGLDLNRPALRLPGLGRVGFR